jgi:hypothetical protein
MELLGRAQLLHAMGVLAPGEKTWRAGWSHDDGKYVYFDAWTNRYHDGRYPMCTDFEYTRSNENGEVRHTDRRTGESTEWVVPRKGHTRWLHHLDLCIQGYRTPVLVNPEPRQAGIRQGDGGAAGWRPQYSLGRLVREEQGHWWFEPDALVAVDTAVDPHQQIDHWAKHQTTLANPGANPAAAARAMIERHIAESQEMLKHFT